MPTSISAIFIAIFVSSFNGVSAFNLFKGKRSAADNAVKATTTPDASAISTGEREGLQSWTNASMFFNAQDSSAAYLVKYRELLADCNRGKKTSLQLWDEFRASAANHNKKKKNPDLRESSKFSDLAALYRANKLITTRLGSIESQFIAAAGYGSPWCGQNEHSTSEGMQTNAGMYFRNQTDQRNVMAWWLSETIDIVRHSVLTSCLVFLHLDLLVWAHIGATGYYYNWGNHDLFKIILRESESKMVLYLGQATDSMQAGYENLQNVWKFNVSNFSFHTVYIPQSTRGMSQPNSSMINVASNIVDYIDSRYSSFDTAVLGCGAWGPPIMNLLRKKYGKTKNLMYLGSETYQLFGVRTRQLGLGKDKDANKHNLVPVAEHPDEGSIAHIDSGKYWRR